jgi:hypothetical protein
MGFHSIGKIRTSVGDKPKMHSYLSQRLFSNFARLSDSGTIPVAFAGCVSKGFLSRMQADPARLRNDSRSECRQDAILRYMRVPSR